MRVIPLGTASGRPTTERNVSATAVATERRWALVDCGEGTQHQILRSALRPGRLDLVLITHLHGDHVLGLPGLLSSVGLDARTEPLQVVGPTGLAAWLRATAATPMLTLSYEVTVTELDEAAFASGDGPHPVAELDGAVVSALPLEHRVPCFGYRIAEPARAGHVDVDRARRLGVPPGPALGRLQRGETVPGRDGDVTPGDVIGPPRPGAVVAVMGDTVPCDNASRLAHRADLLVHEATYRDAEAELATRWRHSTAAGAAGVAAAAGARRLLITHFSARYDGADGLLADARQRFAATDLAVELSPVDVSPVDVSPHPSPGSPPTSSR